MSAFLLYLNLAVSWGLMVLIWLVQLIIYPGFQRVSAEEFESYHSWYVKRISAIVMPLMAAEAVLAAWWISAAHYSLVSVFSGFMVGIVWYSTFVYQVPIHNRLKNGKDDFSIQRLSATNWIRTAAWSAKATVVSIHAVGNALKI